MYPRVLVPLDDGPTAGRSLQEAIELARALGSTLVLLHVAETYPLLLEAPTESRFDEAREALLKQAHETLARHCRHVEQAGVGCETVLREVMSNRVAGVIVEEADRRHCDLIVMGAQGRRSVARTALGSDAEAVTRTALTPVLLVRHEDAAA